MSPALDKRAFHHRIFLAGDLSLTILHALEKSTSIYRKSTETDVRAFAMVPIKLKFSFVCEIFRAEIPNAMANIFVPVSYVCFA